MKSNVAFDFGENWLNYSNKVLSNERIEQAKVDFKNLLGNISIDNRTFLDIGFGQGLSLLIATDLGAQTTGCDINPKCKETLVQNAKKHFNDVDFEQINVKVGSILDESTSNILKQEVSSYDIVHSWGVLHHTGHMYKAIDISASLVKESGYFILAIYNKHWTSYIWKYIKLLYCKSPNFIKKLMIHFFYWLKTLTGYNKPSLKNRGMDFYYDLIDWVGGYPYEFASKHEIESYMSKIGFQLIKFNPTSGVTGCNEFIFKKQF